MKTRTAQHLGKLPDGRRVTRWPVLFVFNSNRPDATLGDWLNPRSCETDVIACTAREAADWALAQVIGIANVEITVIGPKGGTAARRFQGWESSIWSALCARHARAPLQMQLEVTP
jgi:hypothetical protein